MCFFTARQPPVAHSLSKIFCLRFNEAYSNVRVIISVDGDRSPRQRRLQLGPRYEATSATAISFRGGSPRRRRHVFKPGFSMEDMPGSLQTKHPMPLENMNADGQKDHTAQDFCPAAEACRGGESGADLHADEGKEAGSDTDDNGWKGDGDIKNGHGKANGQGVDTGGHGKNNKTHATGGIMGRIGILVIALKGLPEHLPPHKGEEPKGNPMVKGRHKGTDLHPQKPANHWHHGLEQTEMPGETKHLAGVYFFQADAHGHSHGKSVHGKGHGKGDQREYFHSITKGGT